MLLKRMFPIQCISPLISISFLIINTAIRSAFELSIGRTTIIEISCFDLGPIITTSCTECKILQEINVHTGINTKNTTKFSIYYSIVGYQWVIHIIFVTESTEFGI